MNKVLMIGLVTLVVSGYASAASCSKEAKQAVQSIVTQNAKRLGSSEKAESAKQSGSTRYGSIYTVTTQSNDSTYEWQVETTLNCQITKIEFITGL